MGAVRATLTSLHQHEAGDSTVTHDTSACHIDRVGMLPLAVIRHTGPMDRWSSGRELRGEVYEEFVTGVFRRAVRLGRPTREALRDEGLDDADIDEGTAELVARGFLTTTDAPDVWEVVPPRQAVARYAEGAEYRMRVARAASGELEAAWRQAMGRAVTQAAPGLDLLNGIPDIVGRVLAMHLNARERMWLALDGSPAGRELLDRAAVDPAVLGVEAGVVHRLLLDTSLLAVPESGVVMAQVAAAGGSVRLANGLPFGVGVCDGTTALVDISSYDEDGVGSFETRQSPPVTAIAALVERMWLLAAPYEPMVEAARRRELGGSSAPLDERDRSILALLATGASDQVIARRAEVSVRTVERRVRYLMEHLGAATRFQAGAQAVRRGWV